MGILSAILVASENSNLKIFTDNNTAVIKFNSFNRGCISLTARQNFKTLELQNVKLAEGNFDYTLPSVIYHLTSVDLAFIDGNHRREPTENYFHWLLEKANSNSIFIFDDIHWSKGMELAWEHIKEHPSVRCSIDLFFIGIIFFRQEFKEKQHFTIRF